MSSVSVLSVLRLAGKYPSTFPSIHTAELPNLAGGRFLASPFKYHPSSFYARSGYITRTPLHRKLSGIEGGGQLVKVSKECVVSKFHATPKVSGKVLILVGVHQLIADNTRSPVGSKVTIDMPSTAVVRYRSLYKPSAQDCDPYSRMETPAALRSLVYLLYLPIGSHGEVQPSTCKAVVLRTPRHIMKVGVSSQQSTVTSRALIYRPRLDVAIIEPKEKSVAASSKAVIIRGTREIVIAKPRSTRLTSRPMRLICAAPVATTGIQETWTLPSALVFLPAILCGHDVVAAAGAIRTLNFTAPRVYTIQFLKASSKGAITQEPVVRDATFSRAVAREDILFLRKAPRVSPTKAITLRIPQVPARMVGSVSFACVEIIARKALGADTTNIPMHNILAEPVIIYERTESAPSDPPRPDALAPSFDLPKKPVISPPVTPLRPTAPPFTPYSAACKENRKSLNSCAPPFTPPKSTFLRCPQMSLDPRAKRTSPVEAKAKVVAGGPGVSYPSTLNAATDYYNSRTPLRNAYYVLNDVPPPSPRHSTKIVHYKIRSPNEYFPLFEPTPPGSRPAFVGVNTTWFIPPRNDTQPPSRAVTIRAPTERRRHRT